MLPYALAAKKDAKIVLSGIGQFRLYKAPARQTYFGMSKGSTIPKFYGSDTMIRILTAGGSLMEYCENPRKLRDPNYFTTGAGAKKVAKKATEEVSIEESTSKKTAPKKAKVEEPVEEDFDLDIDTSVDEEVKETPKKAPVKKPTPKKTAPKKVEVEKEIVDEVDTDFDLDDFEI